MAIRGRRRSDEQRRKVVVSIGTKGHPHTCGDACKYARRKGGCRDGETCRNCHVCVWQRGRSEKAAGSAAQPQEALGSEEALGCARVWEGCAGGRSWSRHKDSLGAGGA